MLSLLEFSDFFIKWTIRFLKVTYFVISLSDQSIYSTESGLWKTGNYTKSMSNFV